MAVKRYNDWVRELSPTVLLDEWGEKFAHALLGLQADKVAQLYALAVASRNLDFAGLPDDAVELIGQNKALPRVPFETLDNYKTRLSYAWETWQQAGTPVGLLNELARIGLTASIVESWEWDWDGDTLNWSRFWVVITGHPWGAPPKYGDGTAYGSGATYGSSAKSEDVRSVRNLVRLLKPGKAVCSHIIVVLDPTQWSGAPTGNWQYPENRDQGAAYWSG